MGKLLRVLVVLLLLLSIGAMVFGLKLFGQREMLKGRTQRLETAVMAIARAVETEAPALAQKPTLTAKDISPVEAERVRVPELSDFWDSYDAGLESRDEDIPKVAVDRSELKAFYKVDSAGKPMKDAGDGPMQAVLDELIARAGDQYSTLTETRNVLKSLRSETVETIEDLNQQKSDLRDARVEISQFEAKLRATVDPLEAKIANLGDEVAELTEERDALNIRTDEMQTQLDLAVEQVEELEKKLEVVGRTTGPKPADAGTVALEPGVKGMVLEVDTQWNFVILDLSRETLVELLGEELDAQLQAVDFVVRRPGDGGAFVAKVRLIQVKKAERIGVAEILPKWQQLAITEGDVVAF